MSWQLTVYAVPTLLATTTACALAVYTATVFRGRTADRTLLLFLGITVAAAVWTGFATLKLLRTDAATKLLAYRLLHVGPAVLPPLFFCFVLAYTDRTRWLRPGIVALVFAVPVAFLGLLFVNPADAVIAGTTLAGTDIVTLRVTDGPAFLLFSAYSALLAVSSLVIVGYEAARVGKSYYPQAAWLGLGVLTPVLFGAFTAANVPPFGSGVNLVPTAGTVAMLALGVVVFRYQLFELPPLAYTTAMKYSPDALFVLDGEDRIVHANPSGRAVLDVVDGAVDTPIHSLFPEFDPAADDAVLDVATGESAPTYFRTFTEPLERGGRAVGRVAVFRDVTEQHHQQETLRRQAEQLDAFASTVTHDLRNPLTVAQGNLELVKQDLEPDDLAKIESAHSRMAEIIEDVLTLARQGKRIDDPSSVALARVAELSWTHLDSKTATLSVDAERTVEADRTMLQHVFGNLFRNAIEHGGDSVTIHVGTLPDGFFVEDDGPGIPASDRETVLEAGYTTSERGTGYGLEIVQSVVDAHGWSLAVTEGRAGGARFEITGVA